MLVVLQGDLAQRVQAVARHLILVESGLRVLQFIAMDVAHELVVPNSVGPPQRRVVLLLTSGALVPILFLLFGLRVVEILGVEVKHFGADD